MKNKVVIALVIGFALVLAVLTVNTWQNTKVQTQVKKLEEQGRLQVELKKEQQRAKAEEAAKAKLKAQCEAGLKAFNQLTPAQQAKTAKPNCTLQQVQ